MSKDQLIEEMAPREICMTCGSAVKWRWVLRCLADVDRKGESVTLFFICSCGNSWSASYLVRVVMVFEREGGERGNYTGNDSLPGNTGAGEAQGPG